MSKARPANRTPPRARSNADVQVLFVTWDGPRSTYLLGLFLPIFAALQPRGFAFHVLHFTWADAAERAQLEQTCLASGVSYRSVTIWRRPIAVGSFATALFGRRHVRRAMDELNIDLLMPRSTLPALAAIPAAGEGRTRVPVLLDADGLPHDERLEFAGGLVTRLAYPLLRSLEAWSVRRADVVTVRTERAARILADRSGVAVSPQRFHLIASARDARLFRPLTAKARAARRLKMGLASDQPLLVYAGSALSGKYRGQDMLRFFRHVLARRPDARLLVLMPTDGEALALLEQNPDLAPACLLRSAAPVEVPAWVSAADLGLALIHATFSMQAVAAIKLGEYLLCGVPVLTSSGVGDCDTQVSVEVGRCLAEPDEKSLAEAADWFIDTVLPDRDGFRTRCRAVGLAHFSLDTWI